MDTKNRIGKILTFQTLTKLSLRKKVNMLGLFIILLFSVILFVKVLPLLEIGKLEERKGKLSAVVNSVVSLIDHHERGLRREAWKTDATQPKNIEEAKILIMQSLRYMRYDKTEYFFILDGKGKMVMHPLKPELEGQDMMDVKGPKGETIFRDLVIQSQRDSEAFVSYTWQSKYSPLIFEPQTSYAKYYWAWDWIICSGVYTQDILDSMQEINYLSAGYVVVTSAFTIFILFIFVYFNLSRPLMNLLKGIEEIQKDNLDHKVEAHFDDELGHITRQFNAMVENRKESQEELIQLNASLESKVIKRTAELSDTLEEVKELKVRQDGDYFLTSLLLSPLQSKGKKEEKNIKTEFFIKQYKTFSFRKWEAELGGDICITDNIKLNERNYLFFVNADAMGKSIQGAGGALIFGTSVKAALIRINLGKSPTILPETWLKNLYHDLDHLFTTFDGSMLISAVLGLIDEENGIVYFLNTEHPWPVLYRGGKASFIKADHHLMKIGTPEKEHNLFQVTVFQLKDGDTFIAGSDGRDDIILAGTDDVNHDETLFLDIVEKADADIDAMVKGITKIGRLKDDLSLLTINFNSVEQSVSPELTDAEKKILLKATKLHKNNENKAALALLKDNFNNKYFSLAVYNLTKRIYLVEKDYLQYSKLLIRYHMLYPQKNETLAKISKALVLCNQPDQAADYAECLRIREPHNEDNLLHLAKIYKLSFHYNVALSRLMEVLELNPSNELAIKLKENIELLIQQANVITPDKSAFEISKFDY
ncbi:MAG: cache domain-containing protein [Leptospiraceae bacterium]|nr:cache domain-containing protein [Leptospiraceae bacterium]